MPLLSRLRWVSITPLGEPVVPEVYWMLATSPGLTACFGEIAAGAQHGVPGVVAEKDFVLQGQAVAVAGLVQDLAVVGAGIAGVQKERADAGFLKDIAQFMRAVGGVDVDQDDAGARGGVLEQEPFDAVAGPDAGAVAGPEAEAGEAAGGAGDGFVELAPGEVDVLMAHDDGVPFREAGGDIAESLGDRLFEEGHVRPAAVAEGNRFRSLDGGAWHERQCNSGAASGNRPPYPAFPSESWCQALCVNGFSVVLTSPRA